MRSFLLIILITTTGFCATAQDFSTDMATAKTSYAAGKLEDAHFALMQAMQEIDLVVGKEILKLLPAKMDTMSANTAKDEVMTNVGFIGTTIHRTYGQGGDLSIITNSPLIGTINAFLNMPLTGMMSNGTSKIIKVQGYKARLDKEENGTETGYTVQMPLGSSLVTFKVDKCSDVQMMAMANTLPVADIAKLIQ